MKRTRRGLLLALAIAYCGTTAQARETQTYVKNDAYISECGSCHLAYAPGLMPSESWHGIMENLDEHFGENAELDAETSRLVLAYLDRYALGTAGANPTMEQLGEGLPADPPLRITEFPAFLEAHEVTRKQLELEEWPEGFMSPCRDCHRQADDARFEKELLHPGYGPSWPSSSQY